MGVAKVWIPDVWHRQSPDLSVWTKFVLLDHHFYSSYMKTKYPHEQLLVEKNDAWTAGKPWILSLVKSAVEQSGQVMRVILYYVSACMVPEHYDPVDDFETCRR